jgi:hypothetical protein
VLKASTAVAVLVCLLAPAAAHGVDLVQPDGSPATGWQQLADRALVPTPPGTVVFTVQDCLQAGAPECTEPWSDPPRIHIPHPGTAEDRELLLHGLGHVFDVQFMTLGFRDAFESVMGLAGRPWTYNADGAPGEWFAEAYSQCARGPRYYGPGTYEYSPTQLQSRWACWIIRRAAAR